MADANQIRINELARELEDQGQGADRLLARDRRHGKKDALELDRCRTRRAGAQAFPGTRRSRGCGGSRQVRAEGQSRSRVAAPAAPVARSSSLQCPLRPATPRLRLPPAARLVRQPARPAVAAPAASPLLGRDAAPATVRPAPAAPQASAHAFSTANSSGGGSRQPLLDPVKLPLKPGVAPSGPAGPAVPLRPAGSVAAPGHIQLRASLAPGTQRPVAPGIQRPAAAALARRGQLEHLRPPGQRFPVRPGQPGGGPAAPRCASRDAPCRRAGSSSPRSSDASGRASVEFPQRPCESCRNVQAEGGQDRLPSAASAPVRPAPHGLPKAEPGKPLYARKPPAGRGRPLIEKRFAEGERKLHPVRARSGAGPGGRAVQAEPVAPVQREPREITVTEGITVRELAEKLDIRAKELLKVLARPRNFRQHQPGAGCAHGDQPRRSVQRHRAGGHVRRADRPGREGQGRAHRQHAAARRRWSP